MRLKVKNNKEGENMAGEFPWIQFFTSVIAAIALVISIWSLKYSHESNRISKEALTHAKRTFVEEQRPRLQLQPAIGEQLKQSGDKVTFPVTIKIKNTGKTPAMNITCLDDSVKVITPWKEYDFKDSGKRIVAQSLSPDQTFGTLREVHLSFHDEPDMAGKMMAEWAEGRVYVLAHMCLKYTDVSSEHEYNVSARYRLDNQKSIIEDYRDE